MNKRFLIALVAGLAAAFFMAVPALADGSDPAGQNLIANPGFELAGPDSQPRDWSFESWKNNAAFSRGSLDATTAHSGKHSLRLDNFKPDDSRFFQNVAVKPKTWYKFSVWVKTEGVGGSGVGALLSIMSVNETAGDTKGSHDWAKLEYYGWTAADQTMLPVALRLGFYNNEAKGTAWFDDFELTPIAGMPSPGCRIIPLTNPPPTPTPSQHLGIGGLSTAQWDAVGLAICLGFVLIAIRLRQGAAQATSLAILGKSWAPWLATAAIAAVVAIKLALAAGTVGYPSDMDTFAAWAADLVRLGPWGFYRPGYFADYPPGYLYILQGLGGILQLTQASHNSPLFLIILKLPAILTDIGAVWLLWRMAGGRQGIAQNPWLGLAPLLWLISPLASFNSSVWGQVDSVFCLALVAALWQLESRRVLSAAILYAVAVLCKPQALLIAPLAIIWLIQLRPVSAKSILLSLYGFVGTVALFALPFGIGQDPLWLFRLYATTLASYDYASLNAANIWFLFGQNWAANTNVFLGLGYSVWGWIACAAGGIWILLCVWKSRLDGRWLLGAFAVYVLFFAFATKMHERYLFPAALLGLAAYQLTRDRRVFWAAIGAGLICFADVLATLQFKLADDNPLVPYTDPLMLIASIAMVALALYSLYLCYALLWKDKVWLDQGLPAPPPKPAGQKGKALRKPAGAPAALPELMPAMPDRAGRAKAGVALAVIIGVYALAALIGLGSPSSPQRFWEPLSVGDSAIIDLGSAREIKQVEYHLGLGSGDFGLEYSPDGQAWRAGTPIVNANLFAEFRWRKFDEAVTARYVKITLTKGSQQLNELALVDAAGQAQPVASVTPGAAALFDEQSTRVAVSNYYNGMYFDEVYFPRSAWEMLQGRNATENTHPPLGKIIIAGSVAVLGMNPLAWRLPGTLVGIAMIPLVYLLALRLFRQRTWAVLAALFLAMDFMHFTQTRIGTVDTYVMFFVLASYYFMLRWYQDSRDKLAGRAVGLNPLVSLVGSGIAIALAIATKWIGLYAGAGLAVMFFGGFVWLGRDWRQANALKTLATCLGAFVVIPLAVYCAAYIPLMSVTGSGLRGLVENQFSMWNYHSTIRDTHPYSSEWYTWPLMLKPIWYYSGAAAVDPDLASTIVNFGNPVVWYGGSLAFIFLLVSLWLRPQLGERLSGGRDYNRKIAWFIVVALLAQYLPWAVIPRKLVFIYHFFLSVPFIMLALVFVLREFSQSLAAWPRARLVPLIVAALAVGFFIIYFPVISGTPFPRWWGEVLRHWWIPVYI